MTEQEKNALVIPEITSNLAVDDADFNEMAKATAFLPRIALMSANSTLIQEGKMPRAGLFAYVVHGQENPENLGDEFDVAAIAWRPKAMHLLNNAPEGIYYDKKDPLFIECVDRSTEKSDANGGHSFMYGPAFLVWVPKANNGNGGFAEFFCSSKTSRNAAPALRVLLPGPATFKSRFIAPKKSPHKWWGPEFNPCTTPLDNQPDQEKLREEMIKFLNPPKNEKEKAPEENTGRET
jgi:hypothetical protein